MKYFSNFSAVFQQFFSDFSPCHRYDNTITGESANLCVWRRILTTWTGAISCWAVLIMHTHAFSAASPSRSMQHHNPAHLQKRYWTGEFWVSVGVHSVAPYLLLAPGSWMRCQGLQWVTALSTIQPTGWFFWLPFTSVIGPLRLVVTWHDTTWHDLQPPEK